MSSGIWRPMVDAPDDGKVVIKTADERLHLATATVITVGRCSCDGSGGWQEAAWVDENFQPIPEEDMVGWCHVALVQELDRAVQGEIVRAFGVLLSGVKSGARPTNQYAEADVHTAIVRTHRILHTAMGGRIPDEVPRV